MGEGISGCVDSCASVPVDISLVCGFKDSELSGFFDGTNLLLSFVLAKASRFAAASASVTFTEYVGLSLLPSTLSPPPGA